MLREHETLRRVWVLLRPLLASPPWQSLPVVYGVLCAIAHFWR
jgi:hypothetical protein